MTGKPNITLAGHMSDVAHSGQIYHNVQTGVPLPYRAHLQMVVDALKRFGVNDDEMLCAAYLHDSIEDTTTSYGDVEKEQGVGVAELVYAVTSELGRNRKERNVRTYPKIRANPRALILKLGDRIANVEFGIANGGKTEMYAREFPDFYRELHKDFEVETAESKVLDKMWKHLERLLKT